MIEKQSNIYVTLFVQKALHYRLQTDKAVKVALLAAMQTEVLL